MCLLKNVAIVQNNECYFQNYIEKAYEIDRNYFQSFNSQWQYVFGSTSQTESIVSFLGGYNFVYPLLHGLDLCPALVMDYYPSELVLCHHLLTWHTVPSSIRPVLLFLSVTTFIVQIHWFSDSVGTVAPSSLLQEKFVQTSLILM